MANTNEHWSRFLITTALSATVATVVTQFLGRMVTQQGQRPTPQPQPCPDPHEQERHRQEAHAREQRAHLERLLAATYQAPPPPTYAPPPPRPYAALPPPRPAYSPTYPPRHDFDFSES